MFVAKELSRAAQAGLDLVSDEKSTMASAGFACPGQKIIGRHENAVADYGFHHKRRDITTGNLGLMRATSP